MLTESQKMSSSILFLSTTRRYSLVYCHRGGKKTENTCQLMFLQTTDTSKVDTLNGAGVITANRPTTGGITPLDILKDTWEHFQGFLWKPKLARFHRKLDHRHP